MLTEPISNILEPLLNRYNLTQKLMSFDYFPTGRYAQLASLKGYDYAQLSTTLNYRVVETNDSGKFITRIHLRYT
ncbi:MAG: hypothetical protein V7L14_22220 [Nostoc sp.]|uniref:hypothetical protein n=1 Tax=Nostoc sp. TaxID=1180 RepID=UPI002FFAE5B3